MGRAIAVELETRTFRTQTEAEAFFSAMLKSYQVGERVSLEHEVDLRALLKRHTEYELKRGDGIQYFFVDVPGDLHEKPKMQNPGKCFWVRQVSGNKEDFSIGNCITQRSR